MNYSNEVPGCRLLAGDPLKQYVHVWDGASCLCQPRMTTTSVRAVDAEAHTFLLFFVCVWILGCVISGEEFSLTNTK